jgi:hypothetical protein
MARRARARVAQGRGRRPRAEPRSGRDWAKAIGVVGGLVALVGGVVGLVFTFFPGAKPQPPPPTREGSLSWSR